ncbi:hypothetical protein G3T14_21770 [Methylobacterium sp. BTF04]|uniref:hypothetical protein n=1 Tax=Methylobacterium sp. BTF04 TaxID=2708300 RepID=UPI0013D87F36|nr:hypothetical protein [Methylobacterium sp. BTF04]NEU14711.1 hypothetical protein [Methylobacterium sp. BTF04]
MGIPFGARRSLRPGIFGKALDISPFLKWAGATTGPYTLAPGVAHYTVTTPSGAAVTQADLSSHRYHHHVAPGLLGARKFAAYSSGALAEDASGQMVVVKSTTDLAAGFGSAQVAVPPQSTFDLTNTTQPDGSRFSYPRAFVTYAANLYIVSAIDGRSGASFPTGLALVANLCNADGSLGPLFRVSQDAFTPLSGFADIPYDAVLGPPLFALANLYGTWGGSVKFNTKDSSWLGWLFYGGMNLTELATYDNGTFMERLWRSTETDGSKLWVWSQRSYDGGKSWFAPQKSSIPSCGAPVGVAKLPSGKIALVGNPQDGVTNRDPLYLSIHDGTTGAQTALYAIRQGITQTPTYAGAGKIGGAAYAARPVTDGTNLYVAYSLQKESVGMTAIPLAGL